MFQDIIVFTVVENLKKVSFFVIYRYVLWKVWPKKTLFSWRKICRRVWFFLWCLCIDAVRKRLLFLLFFCCICWVCCDCPQNWWFSWCWSINAVVEFKREVSSSFSKTTQGVFSLLAAVLVKLSLFQQIQGHPNFHLKISFFWEFWVFKVQSSSR